MKKHLTSYESDMDYMADQPTWKVVLFGIGMLVAVGVIWVVNLFSRH